jgi:putative ABC transport system ATP-binding protein
MDFAMTASTAVRLERVSKRYGDGPQAVNALLDVTLEVPIGEFVSVMGPSGCGKSTLLNLVAGLDTPTSGHVWIGDKDLALLSDDARSDLRLEHVGFVFQSFNLFPAFTALENVTWPLELSRRGGRQASERAAAALEQVGVDPAAWKRRPAELSGGEQQRVALARALVAEPELLLADEPTGNLDSHTGQAILDLLQRLNADRPLSVVMVTHNTFAATYGHRTIELRDGRIVHEVRAARQPGDGRVVPLGG